MKNEKSKISALLITFNEINHIEKAVDNIIFADEIVVIDSFSTDGTLEFLKKKSGIKLITREFTNFADQRNFAIKQARYQWILFIDADERIPKALKKEILKVIENQNDISGFMIKRQHYFKNKPIKFSGYQTDSTYRLFRNGDVTYDQKRTVHEVPIISGKNAFLKNKMLHYSFTSYDALKSKMEHYGKLKALELFRKNKKANPLHYTIKIIYKFLYNYIIRMGFLDGKEGFTICYLNAYGVYYRYLELKQLSNNSKKK